MHQIGIIFYVYKLGQSYQQIGIILNYIFVFRMFVTLWRHNWPTSFPSIVRKCQPIIPGHYHEDADFYEGDLANNWTMQKKDLQHIQYHIPSALVWPMYSHSKFTQFSQAPFCLSHLWQRMANCNGHFFWCFTAINQNYNFQG